MPLRRAEDSLVTLRNAGKMVSSSVRSVVVTNQEQQGVQEESSFRRQSLTKKKNNEVIINDGNDDVEEEHEDDYNLIVSLRKKDSIEIDSKYQQQQYEGHANKSMLPSKSSKQAVVTLADYAAGVGIMGQSKADQLLQQQKQQQQQRDEQEDLYYSTSSSYDKNEFYMDDEYFENDDENNEDENVESIILHKCYEDYWKYDEIQAYSKYETIELLEEQHSSNSFLSLPFHNNSNNDNATTTNNNNNMFSSCFCMGDNNNNDDDDDDENDILTKNNNSSLFDPHHASLRNVSGILPPGTITVQRHLGVNRGESKEFEPETYQPSPRHRKVVRFAPVKSIVPTQPLHCMSIDEKEQIWYQEYDYQLFKLDIVRLCRHHDEEEKARILHCRNNLTNNSEDDDVDDDETAETMENEYSGSEEELSQRPCDSARSMSKLNVQRKMMKPSGHTPKTKHRKQQQQQHHQEETCQRQPWYKEIGETQRGIEKLMSEEQADEIVYSCRKALYAVLTEQRNQRLLRLLNPFQFYMNNNDKEKEHQNEVFARRIADKYIEYNSWSRDLALAAGASDADAVVQDFNDDERKTREHYLVKQLYANSDHIHKNSPKFMIPDGFIPKGYINENEYWKNNVIITT